MRQPEVVALFGKEYDRDHNQGIYENLKDGQLTKPLWMRMQYAQKMRDKEAAQQEAKVKYCPHCHLALPATGICDMCD